MFMQNTQEINWWAVILPSLISGFFLISVQIITALWLSKKTEDYKNAFSLDLKSFENSLNRRLEDYKIYINKDLYQFQTKFSLFHQRQAAAIEEIYSLLTKTENLLEITRSHFEHLTIDDRLLNYQQNDLPEKEFVETCVKLSGYFDEKRIFFDEDTENSMDCLIKSIEQVYKYSSTSKLVEHKFLKVKDFDAKELWEIAGKTLSDIKQEKRKLQREFRQILSPEMPATQIEK